jgi:hypothetical protein
MEIVSGGFEVVYITIVQANVVSGAATATAAAAAADVIVV